MRSWLRRSRSSFFRSRYTRRQFSCLCCRWRCCCPVHLRIHLCLHGEYWSIILVSSGLSSFNYVSVDTDDLGAACGHCSRRMAWVYNISLCCCCGIGLSDATHYDCLRVHLFDSSPWSVLWSIESAMWLVNHLNTITDHIHRRCHCPSTRDACETSNTISRHIPNAECAHKYSCVWIRVAVEYQVWGWSWLGNERVRLQFYVNDKESEQYHSCRDHRF